MRAGARKDAGGIAQKWLQGNGRMAQGVASVMIGPRTGERKLLILAAIR
ncbi:MAG TPA: hypothetical protein VEJ00_10720 [Candidatus Acidoferrales bacterium]|nr:hypothetical protein [Candidatus Acidoferrales bacterium]